jgi:anthranilate synthase/aminodeoxychorismate synthase-like glutamine amidotransferase
MRLLLIDNYDSFVFNLAQAFGALGAEPVVLRNDADPEALRSTDPAAVVISPGPGAPSGAGVSVGAVRSFGPAVPVLGVCLGHQCIGAAFGGTIGRAAPGPVHGKVSGVKHNGGGIFAGLSNPMEATRYHSLAIEEDQGWPKELEVTARSDDGVVMGVRHRELPIEGVQFHPESILCPEGPRLLSNFLVLAGGGARC